MGRKLFTSGVCVRATHTLLTWAVTLSLFLHDTGKIKLICSQKVSSLLLTRNPINRVLASSALYAVV